MGQLDRGEEEGGKEERGEDHLKEAAWERPGRGSRESWEKNLRTAFYLGQLYI